MASLHNKQSIESVYQNTTLTYPLFAVSEVNLSFANVAIKHLFLTRGNLISHLSEIND